MTAEELGQFYGAALTGGAILSGFIGTFLNFRIQREANYYRQPVLDFNDGMEVGTGKDAVIDLSHFPASLLLIVLSGIGSTTFGVLWPLSALARWGLFMSGPAPILAGIAGSVVLVAGYFFLEMFHYGMFRVHRAEWKREWGMVAGSVAIAVLIFVITYCAVKNS